MKKKYFITGLCMQGNKGGPAIALALTHALKENIKNTEFIFSVPSGEVFELEKKWAKKYGFQVVENITIRHILPPWFLNRCKRKQLEVWLKQLRASSAMIQMSAISYVGPPSLTPSIMQLLSGRFLDFFLSKLFSKAMLAWTQSYGPLSTPFIRWLAKLDLSRQPIVFCRGDDCANEVKSIISDEKIEIYPDIAVILPYKKCWAEQYIKSRLNTGRYVTISPSAVIYNKSHYADQRNKHVLFLKEVCLELQKRHIQIVLIPHTNRLNNHDPKICDYGVCNELLKQLDEREGILLINDDLSPIELKSIISLAKLHISGRYHSVIASLSSGVPTISLSWHMKYKDIMRVYGMENYIISDNTSSFTDMIDDLFMNEKKIRSLLHKKQDHATQQIEKNVKNFVKLLEEICDENM